MSAPAAATGVTGASAPPLSEEAADGAASRAWRRLPWRIRVLAVVAASYLAAFLALRGVFWAAFRDTAGAVPAAETLHALYLGLKFDLRLALVVALPLLLLSFVPGQDLRRPGPARRLAVAWLAAASLLAGLTYAVDLGHHAYVQERVNAAVFDLLANPVIALEVVRDTYAVVPGLLAVLLLAGGHAWLVRRLAFGESERRGRDLPRWARAPVAMLAVAALVAGLYGKWSWYPLRWSDAYFGGSSFSSALALNPVWYLVDTLRAPRERADPERARALHPHLIELLGVEDAGRDGLGLARRGGGAGGLPPDTNVLIVIMESLAAHKLGSFGNPLDPTPNLDRLAAESTLFTHAFVPRAPTARSIYSFAFGVPDLSHRSSASRNPLATRQPSLLAAFTGHRPHYFIGGSASWGNIRGMLAAAVPGLTVHEEGSYQSPRNDVWGISDWHLFEEAHAVLAAAEGPFLAVIQTAGNHRPYTIPRDVPGFAPSDIGDETARAAGFQSAADLEAQRFMDHALGRFLDLAGAAGYLDRSLLVLFGDHGTVPPLASPWRELGLASLHVPLLLRAPGWLPAGGRVDRAASTLDVLPTVAGLLGVPHVNSGLGRDLFSERTIARPLALIVHDTSAGLLDDELFLRLSAGGSRQLFRYRSAAPLDDVAEVEPRRADELETTADALLETSRLLLQGRPRAAAPRE